MFLKDQIIDLIKEHDELKTTVLKFIIGKENLDVIYVSQHRCGFNKDWLRYIGETINTNDKSHVKSKKMFIL